MQDPLKVISFHP